MVKCVFQGTHTVIAYAQDLWIVVEIPFDFHSQMIKKGNVFLMQQYYDIYVRIHRSTLDF